MDGGCDRPVIPAQKESARAKENGEVQFRRGMQAQIDDVIARKGRPSLDRILSGDKTWTIL